MRPEETRAKILDATDHLFGALGFDATTTRDIAERSGVNKALIHYHFGSKDELLSALLDGYYDRLSATLIEALQKSAEPELQAGDVIDAYADFRCHGHTVPIVAAGFQPAGTAGATIHRTHRLESKATRDLCAERSRGRGQGARQRGRGATTHAAVPYPDRNRS